MPERTSADAPPRVFSYQTLQIAVESEVLAQGRMEKLGPGMPITHLYHPAEYRHTIVFKVAGEERARLAEDRGQIVSWRHVGGVLVGVWPGRVKSYFLAGDVIRARDLTEGLPGEVGWIWPRATFLGFVSRGSDHRCVVLYKEGRNAKHANPPAHLFAIPLRKGEPRHLGKYEDERLTYEAACLSGNGKRVCAVLARRHFRDKVYGTRDRQWLVEVSVQTGAIVAHLPLEGVADISEVGYADQSVSYRVVKATVSWDVTVHTEGIVKQTLGAFRKGSPMTGF